VRKSDVDIDPRAKIVDKSVPPGTKIHRAATFRVKFRGTYAQKSACKKNFHRIALCAAIVYNEMARLFSSAGMTNEELVEKVNEANKKFDTVGPVSRTYLHQALYPLLTPDTPEIHPQFPLTFISLGVHRTQDWPHHGETLYRHGGARAG